MPNLRFPEFEGEWEECTIGDYGDIITGNTPPTKDSANYKDGTYLWASPSDLGSYKFITETQTKLSSNGFDKTRKLSAGSVLVTCIGSTIGKMGMALTEMSTNQQINSIVVKKQYNNHFVYYALQSRFPRYLNSVAVQAVPIISKSSFEKLTNYKTSLEEQKKIGTLLNLIDERIATQNRIIEDLKQLRSAITNRIIYNLVADKKFVPFSAIYQMAGEGGTPNTNNRQYYEGGTIPFIKIDDLSSKYLTRNKDFITEIGLQKSSAWVIPANSLIYSNGATIGAVSINTYKVATKQGILGIVPKSTVCVEYLYYLTTSTFFKKQIHRIITHGTMTTAYLKDINKIKVPLPDIEEQNKVIKGLITLSEKIEKEQEILANFQAQKKYLLHQMFI